MRKHRFVGRCIVVGFGVIALACAGYLALELWNKFDCIWADIWGPWSLTANAEKCLERGDYDGALRCANRAVQCRPDMKVTYDVRARVYEARGEFRESIEDYTKLVSLGDYLTLARRGRVYEKMGKFDKAAADYCEVLRIGRTKSGGSSNVRLVALNRVMGPGEDDSDRHPDAVSSLLKFINEAIAKEPDNRDLRDCREMILRSEQGS